jgi:predicted HTH domain antitoxin
MMPDDLKKEIDNLKTLYNEEQSSLIRRLLKKSINDEKIEIAVKMYIDEKISLGKAAELAGISIWEILDELKRRNIGLKYKISDAELEVEKLLKRYEKR